jgi:hypothetical protein
MLDTHTIADHPAVVQILKEGWKSHIPMMALTSKNCWAASFMDCSSVLDDKKKSQLSVDAAAEASMPLADWLEAWPGLCSHVNKHYIFQVRDKVADAFQKHFSGIMSRFDFKSKFTLYLEYNIHIRTLWVSEPGAFHPA